MKPKKIAKLILIVLLSVVSLAEKQIVLPSTAENFDNAISFEEISFNDKTADWIMIRVFTQNLPPNNLIEIKEDSVIAVIPAEKLATADKIIIRFKSEKEKIELRENILEFSSPRKGLVKTTEQLTIEINNQIVDAVCWKNSSPPAAEEKDILALTEQGHWQGGCLDSNQVKPNYLLRKISKGKTSTNWQIIAAEPPLKPKNPSAKTTGNAQNFKTSSNAELELSEIFPNPSGTDKGLEWLEIKNKTSKIINLQNHFLWINKKMHQIKETLPIHPGGTFVLEEENLKFSIPNTTAEIKLLNPSQQILDEISYEKAPEDKSLAKTEIRKNNQIVEKKWLWTTPGKAQVNPVLYRLTGKITEKPKLQNSQLSLTLSPTETPQESLKLLLPVVSATSLNLNILKKNTSISGLAQKITDKEFLITEYEIINQTINTDNLPEKSDSLWDYLLIIPCSLLLAFVISYFLTKNYNKSLSNMAL